jgi:hypothetical protein
MDLTAIKRVGDTTVPSAIRLLYLIVHLSPFVFAHAFLSLRAPLSILHA